MNTPWINEAETLKAAHEAAQAADDVALETEWFFNADMETLGLMKLHLAPNTQLMAFRYDVLRWQPNDPPPNETACFTAVGKDITPLSEPQYRLLDAIAQSSMLGEALDHWVNTQPEYAATHAGDVGEWLRIWITQGVLSK